MSSHLQSTRPCLGAILALISAQWIVAAQDPTPLPSAQLLIAWDMPDPRPGSFLQRVKEKLNAIGTMVIRVTSPDVAVTDRRLWIVPASGGTRRQLSSDAGVRNPRWGAGGYIAYEIETDSNNDGFIDARDTLQLRIIPASGGASLLIGEGRSPVWSPDGRYVAFLRGKDIWVADLVGEAKRLGPDQQGRIIFTDRSSRAAAGSFWALDIGTNTTESLPVDGTNRYLWLGAISPSSTKIVFHDAMQTDIFVRNSSGQGIVTNITKDKAIDFDPAWSPDEKFIVFVSDQLP